VKSDESLSFDRIARGVMHGAAGGVANIVWIYTYAADTAFVRLPKASPAYDIDMLVCPALDNIIAPRADDEEIKRVSIPHDAVHPRALIVMHISLMIYLYIVEAHNYG
jgi:hypothetical protein